jgi:anaerobic ribonucleoside-triphosphate reductase
MDFFKYGMGTGILYRSNMQKDLNELWRIWKELVVAYSKVLYLTYNEQLRCTMRFVLLAKCY